MPGLGLGSCVHTCSFPEKSPSNAPRVQRLCLPCRGNSGIFVPARHEPTRALCLFLGAQRPTPLAKFTVPGSQLGASCPVRGASCPVASAQSGWQCPMVGGLSPVPDAPLRQRLCMGTGWSSALLALLAASS